MPEADVTKTVVVPENTAQSSDAVTNPEVTDPPEKVAETDEQKNERVAREAAEASEKRSRGVQKRIDELTADKHAERRRADELAATNARILALLESKQTPAQTEAKGEPVRVEGESYEEYILRVAEHRARAIVAAELEATGKAQAEQRQRETAEQSARRVESTFLERQREFAKATPDFNEVMENASDLSVPTTVFEALKRIPEGPMVAYHMLKNPELAKQFTVDNAELHTYILGQLAATLKSPQKTTTAPAPGKPAAAKVGSDNEPPTDPDKYRAWADKNLK